MNFLSQIPKKLKGHYYRASDAHFILGSDDYRNAAVIMRKRRMTRLEINPIYHTPDNLDFLKHFGFVTEIHILPVPIDLNSLNEFLPDVKLIHLEPGGNSYTGELNLSLYRNLEHFIFEGTFPGIETLNDAFSLKRITMFDCPFQELYHIAGLNQLEHLKLVNSKTVSIIPVQNFKKLKVLELLSMKFLDDLSPISALKLKKLDLYSSRGIVDSLEVISGLKELLILNLASLKEVSSVDFLSGLTRLEYLNLLGTRIMDNDLAPIYNLHKNHSLRFVNFSNSKQYIYTREQCGYGRYDPIAVLAQIECKI